MVRLYASLVQPKHGGLIIGAVASRQLKILWIIQFDSDLSADANFSLIPYLVNVNTNGRFS